MPFQNKCIFFFFFAVTFLQLVIHNNIVLSVLGDALSDYTFGGQASVTNVEYNWPRGDNNVSNLPSSGYEIKMYKISACLRPALLYFFVMGRDMPCQFYLKTRSIIDWHPLAMGENLNMTLGGRLKQFFKNESTVVVLFYFYKYHVTIRNSPSSGWTPLQNSTWTNEY